MAIIDGKLDFKASSLTSDSSLMKDTIVALEEPGTEEARESENLELQSLVAHIKRMYNKAKDTRQFDETRWLEAYDNYRGHYSSQVQFLEQEKSRAFIKITKTKVLASYAQILDIIFAANKFPIGIEPTPIPMGVAESVHFDPQSADEMAKKNGKAGGSAPAPSSGKSATIARSDILNIVGGLKEQLSPVKDMLKEGPGLTPTSQTWEPAKEAAKMMERLIHDQLHEADASKSMRNVIFDMCLFGTGLMKGPFALDKEYPKWDEDGKYSPLFNTIADVQHVSIWDAYPDPDAKNMGEAEYFVQRHKMSKTQLRALKRRPHFRKESIEKAIDMGADYTEEYWEQSLSDSTTQAEIDRFEVLEYWGIIDEKIAEDTDLDIPADLKDRDQIQINAWICNDQLLRVVLNPFTPARIPFFACPYELNPYSFFGIGVAENMTDTQLLMNGFIRLAVDNATLSSNIVFEIDETYLVPGQDMKLYPGKIFRRQGGQPGQSIFATKFPNVTQECLAMFDKARQLADEATGMPSYAHGQAGVTGIGRTASGMSMLMGAAKENIKAVVRNLDDYLFVPLGKGMFAFNMQFNFDKRFLGDVDIVARGTESLMRNEIRSQKLMQFLQIGSNPMDAPFIKRDYILRELATSLDLEADKTVNDPREAAIQAETIKKMNEAMGIPAQQPGAANPAAAPGAGDPTQTGGGNIAPGAAPPPGAEGFTGNPQQAGPPPQ
jgi:hypothetical protein